MRMLGPYEILEILGEGSFGTVCVGRAQNDPSKRKVALKVLKPAYTNNKKILNRTRDEARLLSQISHPNIVRVEALARFNTRTTMVMEYVEGVSLDQLLIRFKDGLPGAVAIEVTRLMCLALHVAFAEAVGEDGRPMRVIHRDIKPSNVLLSVHGEVKVVDFGIAKGEFEGREAETESVVMGSRPYMAPERLDGMNDSPAVDVYSAGMSLYELLTGRTMGLSINPVNHDQAMTRQLQYVQVPGMSQGALDDLRNLIRRMCAYSRDYRPTAFECVKDLEALSYAIEPRYRIGLEEFARTTVVPIYESRPRTSPDEAIAAEDDEGGFEDISETLGAPKTNPKDPAASPSAPPVAVGLGSPIWFVGGLLGAVAVLASLALLKYALTPDQNTAPSQVRVEVWIPSDADATLDDQVVLLEPGAARLDSGHTTMKVTFETGRVVMCEFDAVEGLQVTMVYDAGRDGITLDKGAFVPCRQITTASSPGGASTPGP
jgi:eukaryotic-like serine/threonine-protein kinase